MRRSPKPGAFTAHDVERAAELVDDERGEGFAFDVFGDDQERLAGVDDGFQHGDEVLDARDLLFVDEDVGVFELAGHRGRIGDEVRREVAAVELHALDPFDFGAEALAFVDGDDAVFADLFHGFGEHLADFGVAVRGDGADLGHLFGALDLDRHLLELGRDVFDGLLDAFLHVDGVDARGDGLEAFVEDGFGEDGGGGGAVAGDVAGLAGDFLHHLGAHVFVDVFELNFLGDGDAVFGDGRASRRIFGG